MKEMLSLYEVFLSSYALLNELKLYSSDYSSVITTFEPLFKRFSVNFTVVHSLKCLYSIYLSSETKRRTLKNNLKKLLKSY